MLIMRYISLVLCLSAVCANPVPRMFIRREVQTLGDFPQYYQLENQDYNQLYDRNLDVSTEVPKESTTGRTFSSILEFYRDGLLAGLNLVDDYLRSPRRPEIIDDVGERIRSFQQSLHPKEIEPTTESTIPTSPTSKSTITTSAATKSTVTTSPTTASTTTTTTPTEKPRESTQLIPILSRSTESPQKAKFINIKANVLDNQVEQIPEKKTKNSTNEFSESQEIGSSEEEEPKGIAGLANTFLSGLSRPDGTVDLEGIVNLIAGLSAQRPDGSVDFSGLTELLRGTFADPEGGGGSDVGRFLGGLIGATVQGSANPPGAKGAGALTGNILKSVLPGLSAPAPLPPLPPPPPPPQPAFPKPLDSGSFLLGLISSLVGGSSASATGALGSLSGGSSGGGVELHPPPPHAEPNLFIQLGQNLLKTVLQMTTSLIGASSHSG